MSQFVSKEELAKNGFTIDTPQPIESVPIVKYPLHIHDDCRKFLSAEIWNQLKLKTTSFHNNISQLFKGVDSSNCLVNIVDHDVTN